MSLTRKLIRRETYRGRTLSACYLGPDLIAFVNEIELGNFYVDAQAAIEAGKRYVDAEEKAKAEKAAKEAKTTRR